MTTSKQLVANRANAKNSTGPKTAAGKARSRMNACRHGLTAEDIVAPCESPERFEALRAALWEQFDPGPGLESVLVDRLVSCLWRLNRVPLMERESFRSGIELGYAVYTYFPLLSRYDTALQNDFNRTLQQLLALQDRRLTNENNARSVVVLPGS